MSASQRTGPTSSRRRLAASDVRHLVAFALLYLVAAAVGRQTVDHSGGVALIWPAAGVSVLWLVARAGRPAPWADAAAIAVLTAAVAALTGTSWPTGLLGGVAAALQAWTCAAVLARRVPPVWAAHGARALQHVDELWWLLIGASAGALVSAPLATAALAMSTGSWSWTVALLWCARNVVSIVAVCTLGFVVGDLVRRRRRRRDAISYTGAALPWTWGGRSMEWLGALVVPPAVYVLWFVGVDQLAVVFPLIALTVWAGARLPSPFVVLHNTAMGATAIGLTMAGYGPFLTLSTPSARVGVAQLYVGLVSLIGLSLALAREDRARLVVELGEARDRAQSQAALLATIVDTMSEGVRVVDRTGRVLVRNPAATRLLLGTTHVDGERAGWDVRGIQHLDGTDLSPEELPYRRALAGERVRDLDLLVLPHGARSGRIVSFTATPIPDDSGGGVVTLLRDVTRERAELRRAAQVQESLLPPQVPQLPGYDVDARFVPAGSVGGDFYDWLEVPGGLVLTLADVMGKGTAAAILAATTRAVLRAHPGPDVADTVRRTERLMTDDLVNAGSFVTLFRAHLDAATGDVGYVDAGHGLSLLVRRDGGAVRLESHGVPLGLGPDGPRDVRVVTLNPGDVLVTFSDAVLDALGGSVRNLVAVEDAVRGASTARHAVEAVLELVGTSDAPSDDLTVIALLRRPAEASDATTALGNG